MIGTRIAHYHILEKIGEGGMGEVFIAEDTRLDRRVALKILSARNADPERVARFEREAKAAAALNHPNILSIHDFGREGSTPYVVMELLDGRTLREQIDAGPLPLRKALRQALEMVHGMAAAHERGICHRDLKPANIFVTRDGRVKILDFGLASIGASASLQRTLSSEGSTHDLLTSPGALLGTVGYMAPEQVRGETADHRADIFSFGAVLFEILTGRRAFSEPSPIETMHSILKKDPPLQWLQQAGVPAPLFQIVCRCLEKRPDQRFQSAADIAFAVQTLVEAASLPPDSSSASFVRETLARTRAAVPSIAVLPFRNMSADADTEYFSDGVTEDIINALAQLKDLRVAARTSAFSFKGQSADIAEVGAKLKVDTVLEGSVRRVGKRLRVTAQLINVADGYHLWSERYDRELDDVFAIQDDIARNIAAKLQVTLGATSGAPTANRATEVEAYDLYLKGRYFVEQRGEGIGKGLEFFNRAIAVDPQYAPAYAGVAETMLLMVVYGIGSPAQWMPRAKQAAARALELDDRLAEAHNAMAMVSLMWDWDWDRAEAEFNRALALKPSHAPAHYWKGLLYHLFVRGREGDALQSTMRAIELDPIAMLAVYAHGLVLLCSGRYGDAIALARELLDRDPTAFLMYRIMGTAQLAQGNHEESIGSLEKGLALSMRHHWFLGELGVVYVRLGRSAEAEKFQEELLARARTGFMSPLALSVIPLAQGKLDEAFHYLELALEQKDPLVIALARWPTFEAVRSDPRGQAMLRRMNIVWERG